MTGLMLRDGPLGATQERLRGLRPGYPHVYAVQVGVPDEPDWYGVDEVLADGTVTDWWEQAHALLGSSSVAAVRVVGRFGHSLLGRAMAALVLERRAHDVSPENVALHLDEDGRVDRVAVRRATVGVLPGDPAAGSPDAVVLPGEEALLDWVAQRAIGTLTPVVDQLRVASRFGVVPQWNALADAVLGSATFVPLYAGADETAGRTLGEALLDALVARGARIRTRGGTEVLARRGRSYALPVRGSCCLHYKTEPEVVDEGDQYCSTCPFLADDLRRRRFETFLDEHVPHRAAPA